MSDNRRQRSRQVTRGDARNVLLWKVIEYAGLFAYILYFPRVMSLSEFGELAVVVSLTSIFWIASSLGAQAIFGRFIPEMIEQGRDSQVRILYSQMFITRTLSISILALLYPVILAYFLPAIGASERWLATAVFVTSSIGGLFFQLQFGLNNLGKWIIKESSAKLLLVAVVVAMTSQPTLEQILQVMLAIELGFFVIGLVWARSYFYFGPGLLDFSQLSDGLKFGLTFFFSNLLLLAVWRVGEVMLARLSSVDALELVAQYSVANAIAFTAYGLLSQLSVLLLPSLTAFYTSGDTARYDQWLGYMLKYACLIVVVSMIIIYSVGDVLILFVFGEGYVHSASLLFILLAALLPMSIIRVAMSGAMVKKLLEKIFVITLPVFVCFTIAGMLLTPDFGATGTSLALVIAAIAGAAVAIRTSDLGRILGIARFWVILPIGVLALLVERLVMLGNVLDMLVAVVIFLAGILLFRVISLQEVRSIYSGIR